MTSLLLTRARLVGGDGRPRSVLIEGGHVTAVGHQPAVRSMCGVDLDGRFVMRGLWDHHVHLDQWALARSRLELTTCRSALECAAVVRSRLADDPPPPGEALLGYGFRDALWPTPPSLSMLDEVAGARPVALISNDLHSGWLNSAAFGRYGLEPRGDGLVREATLHALLPLLDRMSREVLDGLVRSATRAAAARGVTGLVDFEMADNVRSWSRRVLDNRVAVRLVASVYPEHSGEVAAAHLRTGDALAGSQGLVTVGSLKVFVDGSLNARTASCRQPYEQPPEGQDPHGLLLLARDELGSVMSQARSQGLHCAVHAIGDRANSVALDGFASSGAAGSVEHAQLLTADDLPRFAQLRVAASVQPGHAIADRDVADRHWAGRTEGAFAYASLLAAGAKVRFGSDAPVSPLDPWLTLAAAVHRSDDGRPPWHPEQHLSVAAALTASTRGRFTVRRGDQADLVVLDRDPLTAPVDTLRAMPVCGTLVAGRWTHQVGLTPA